MFFVGILESLSIIILLPLMKLVFHSRGEVQKTKLEIYFDRVFDFLNFSPTVLSLLIIMLLLIVTKVLFTFLANIYVDKFILGLVKDFRLKILNILFNAKWEYFVNKRIGNISNVIGSEVVNACNVFYCSSRILSNLIQIIIFLVIALFLNPVITLIALAVGSFVFFITSSFIRKSKEDSKRKTKKTDSFVTLLLDFVQGIKSLKAMNLIKGSMNILIENANEILRTTINLAFYKRGVVAIQELANSLIIIIILFLFFQFNLVESFEFLVIMILLFHRCVQKLNTFQNEWQRLAISEYPFIFINNFLKEGNKKIEKDKQVGKRVIFKNKISLKNIFFKYPNDKMYTLKKINLSIKKNSVICIYGKSGSGKTTLVDIIIGLLKPTKGKIEIDGINLDNYSFNDWRNNLGYVTQDSLLFNDSLKNNILVDGEYNSDSFKEILKDLDLLTISKNKKVNIEKNIGERGQKLSGGQRQRVSIARAIYKNPQILILDEPTSSLDKETEDIIIRYIKKLKLKMTIIIISHTNNFETVADNVIRISEGQAN